MKKANKIAVLGLGYVGLPLAVVFGNKYETIGFDINKKRVKELNLGIDNTLELERSYLKKTLNNDFFKSIYKIKINYNS